LHMKMELLLCINSSDMRLHRLRCFGIWIERKVVVCWDESKRFNMMGVVVCEKNGVEVLRVGVDLFEGERWNGF
ncbi:hypothetical protein, partial [Bacillus sp. WP8]|uniref:hypothetical protein n=1 Tax=Bacillus sp. WP8 TaxID=756828 RepID=UPI001C92C687